MKTTTILKLALLTAALVQPLHAESKSTGSKSASSKSSAPLSGKTLASAYAKDRKLILNTKNASGPVNSNAAPLGTAADAPTQTAFATEAGKEELAEQVVTAIENKKNGGTVTGSDIFAAFGLSLRSLLR